MVFSRRSSFLKGEAICSVPIEPTEHSGCFDALGRRIVISVENGLSFPEAMEHAKLKYEENTQFRRLVQHFLPGVRWKLRGPGVSANRSARLI